VALPFASAHPAPAPLRGLAREDFRCIGGNGLGDPLNAYPHSMAWWNGHLYVGTTRSNLCMLKVSKIRTNLAHWPVDCPDNLYELDMRAQIWRYQPEASSWQPIFQSPMITGKDTTQVPRELGYRCMAVFQGESDAGPALYTSTYASAKGAGTQILRCVDQDFTPVPRPQEFGEFVTTLRLLVPFKDRLFTSPTGRAEGNPNAANLTVVFETRDPLRGQWKATNTPSFGDPGNISVFEMIGFGDYLYAGTGNFSGYQIWRTDAEGDPPYKWERVTTLGAYRGKLNQGVASFCVFKGALYVGSGIQHGGVDIANKVGPAGPELIRIHPDGRWDLIVGTKRDTPDGGKVPLSGFGPGFDNLFAGYFWRMGAHDGWLYVGTFDWSLMLRYSNREKWPELFRAAVDRVGLEQVLNHFAGAHLYRSSDGENWLPVTENGFDNYYNYGIRGILSTPLGLAVGTVNPFGPRVATCSPEGWRFEDNPRGGLEIWLGSKADWIRRP
jgi:hypothetical protein